MMLSMNYNRARSPEQDMARVRKSIGKLIGGIAVCVSGVAFAGNLLEDNPITPAGSVTVGDPWIRATVPGQLVTGLFLQLNPPQAATLVSVSCRWCLWTQLHRTIQHEDIAKMESVTAIPLPAGEATFLQPGGYHVMIGIDSPMKSGERVTATLHLRMGGESIRQAISATVRLTQ